MLLLLLHCPHSSVLVYCIRERQALAYLEALMEFFLHLLSPILEPTKALSQRPGSHPLPCFACVEANAFLMMLADEACLNELHCARDKAQVVMAVFVI